MIFSSHSPDEDLIAGCLEQNRLAQKYLYKRYYGRVMGISMRYTRNEEEALDILNRSFLKVFTKLDQYKPTGSLGGWIARVVFNTAIDYVRSNTRYRKVMDFNIEKESSLDPDIFDKLYMDDVYKAIQKLPSNSRAVFSLFYIDGYKHKEIAELLDININTSKWLLSTAKKQMRIIISKTMDEPLRKRG